MATASRPTAPPLPERELDNVCFLDWLARLSGYWQHPGHPGTYRVEFDRGAVLRVTDAVGDEPYPLTLIDLDEEGIHGSGLSIRRQRPALALAELRADGADARLLLEADLQRRRLYPRWIGWLEEMAREDPDPRHSDLFLLRFQPEISFDDLAVVARTIRPVGPGLMWALFRADATKAAALFEEWVDDGDHRRFSALGGQFETVLMRSYGKPTFRQLARVNQMMVQHGYARTPDEAAVPIVMPHEAEAEVASSHITVTGAPDWLIPTLTRWALLPPMTPLMQEYEWIVVWSWLNAELAPQWMDSNSHQRFLVAVPPQLLWYGDSDVRRWQREELLNAQPEVTDAARRLYVDGQVILAGRGADEHIPEIVTLVEVEVPGGISLSFAVRIAADGPDAPGGPRDAWRTDELEPAIEELERQGMIVGLMRWLARPTREREAVAVRYRVVDGGARG